MAFPFGLAGALDPSVLCAIGSVVARFVSSIRLHTIFRRPAGGVGGVGALRGRTRVHLRLLGTYTSDRALVPRTGGGRAI